MVSLFLMFRCWFVVAVVMCSAVSWFPCFVVRVHRVVGSVVSLFRVVRVLCCVVLSCGFSGFLVSCCSDVGVLLLCCVASFSRFSLLSTLKAREGAF